MQGFAKEEGTNRTAANGGAKMRSAPEGARIEPPKTYWKRQQSHVSGHDSYAIRAVDPLRVPFEEGRNPIKLEHTDRDTRNLPRRQQHDLFATDTESLGDSTIEFSISDYNRGQHVVTTDTRPLDEIGTDDDEADDGESGSDDEPGFEEDDGVEGAFRRVEQDMRVPRPYSADHEPDVYLYPRSYPSTTSGHPDSPPNGYRHEAREDLGGQRESMPPFKVTKIDQALATHNPAQISIPVHTARPIKQPQMPGPTQDVRDSRPVNNGNRQETQSDPHITKRSDVARGQRPAPPTSSLAVNLQYEHPQFAASKQKQERLAGMPTTYSESHAQQDHHTPGEPGSHIPVARPAQEQRHDRPISQSADYQDGNGAVTQEEELPYKELDYHPEELFEKTYESLKAENFDFDPLPMAKLPEGLADASLGENLSSMAGEDALAQAQFFNTLDIDQWEEAGDWFLDRFSEVLTRLKTARREKRDLARSFESEVEQRHEAVSRKRKATDSALEDMKKNGGLVLQRTPKKQKQKSKQ